MTRLKREKDLPSGHETDVRFGTPEEVAEYRAEKLCKGANTIVEIGAGAGFQTRSFAKRADKVIAVDIDEERLQRGTFADNVHVITGDALEPATAEEIRQEAKGRIVIFLDPERPASSMSRSLDEIQPNLEKFFQLYRTLTEDIAIELPPFLSQVPWECEHEYISVQGQLNRHTIYLGGLGKCDVSVTALPGRERIEHEGPLPRLKPQHVNARYLLEPDRALSHAGLTAKALPERYNALHLGRRQAYLAEEKREDFFTAYKIIASGSKKDIVPLLETCETVILHGSMEQEEQKGLLKELNEYCKGDGRMHLFLADRWYLTERDAQI